MSEQLRAPKSDALKALFWRSEILQVMFWLRGEGLGDDVTPEVLERFLGVVATVVATYMDRLVQEGFLDAVAGRYWLSERGAAEGAEEFESAFSQLTRPTHGECSADCWCHASVEEAEACAAERTADGDH